MDPTSITSILVVYGPLGVMAAIGILWKYQADQRVKAFEEKQTEAANKFAIEIAELQSAHRDEVTKLTDRFVSLVVTYGDHYRQLLDRVSTALELITRKGPR